MATTNKLESPLVIKSGDELIFSLDKIRDLGIHLDPHLCLHLHNSVLIKICVYHLRNIAKIRKFQSFDICQAIVHAFISSRRDYCNSLLYGLSNCQLNQVQFIQDSAPRFVLKSKLCDHLTPLLKLHSLPVRERIMFMICLVTYKALLGDAFIYIYELLKRH